MLQPRRTKYRKMFRGRRKGNAVTGSTVEFGEFGLKAMACEWITARQIESARIAITRHLQRGGQVWIRVFPDKPVSKKPAEVRMGGGKAANDHWVAVVKPGADPVRGRGSPGGPGGGSPAAGVPQAAGPHQDGPAGPSGGDGRRRRWVGGGYADTRDQRPDQPAA